MRLFPAYYILIIIFFLARNFFDLFIWDNDWNFYYFFYLSNWYWYLHPGLGSGSFNHIWSLGVEEQFYLVWPWLIIFLPLKKIKYVIIFSVVFAIFLNVILYNKQGLRMLPFLSLHTLGIGGLLGYYHYHKPTAWVYQKILSYRNLILILSIALLLFILLYHPFTDQTNWLLTQVFLCLATGALVIKSVYGWGRFPGFFFKNKYIQFIGKISYGIYLYHMPVPDTFKAIMKKFGVKTVYEDHPYVYLLVFCSITLLVSILSYKIIEIPFLRLKSKFELKQRAQKKNQDQLIPIVTSS